MKNILFLLMFMFFLSSCLTLHKNVKSDKQLTKEEVDKIYEEVSSIIYKSDIVDEWQLPNETIEKKTGDCEDKSILFYHKIKSSGNNKVRIIIGRTINETVSYHAWNEIEIDNTTYIVDTTARYFSIKTKDNIYSKTVPNELLAKYYFSKKAEELSKLMNDKILISDIIF